jgi:NAD(P)-dependent dehydrogenase (short-subunit alcohol dehydrogenase family)
MDRLRGKKALVVGASTGIGRAVCRLFAEKGADVAVADLGHAAEKASLVDELAALGRRTFAIDVDVLVEEQVRAAVMATLAEFGHLDILINNAGIGGPRRPVIDEPVADWERMVNVNLRGVFFGMKHGLPPMLERGYGRVINTASQLAHKPSPFNASYCAAKAGVVALTAAAAQEVATQGVTVNAVCPGPTDTPMWRTPGSEEWNQWKIESLPMKRIGQPEEIAWAYVYVVSDEASYCTGQSLSPNGGDVMW